MKKENVPPEWKRHLSECPVFMEYVDYPLYSTQVYISDTTDRLTFFQTPGMRSNVPMHNCLPNPQAFLLQSIVIEGISSSLRYGRCRLQIMNKIYLDHPAWMFTLREKGMKLDPFLVIGPLTFFIFEISWFNPCRIGKGLSGEYQVYRDIQVVFHGQLARPVQ